MHRNRQIDRHLKRLLTLVSLATLGLFLMGCGGDDGGIRNGTIAGQVFSSLRDNSAERNPESGVVVVLQREAEPRIIRSLVTDAQGRYSFSEVPLGTYALGFAKEGFRPVTTEAGATANRSAVGNQVRVFVESKSTSIAPEVTLTALQQSGNAILVVTLIDRLTGVRVTTAEVQAGVITTIENSNGVYTLQIPIIRQNDSIPFDNTARIQVVARAPGYRQSDNLSVDLVAGQTFRRTIFLEPEQLAIITGRFVYARFQDISPRFSQIELTIPNVPDSGADPDIGFTFAAEDTGEFVIRNLPVSTPTLTRTVDLIFTHPNLQTETIRAVVLPTVGNRTILQDIVLDPITVDVSGEVAVFDQNATPSETLPNGANDRVLVVETGQTASIINGTFLIPDVPVRQSVDDTAGFTLEFTGRRPRDGVSLCETVNDVRPRTDGLGNTNTVYFIEKVILSNPCGGTGS